MNAGRGAARRSDGARCNKSTRSEQGPRRSLLRVERGWTRTLTSPCRCADSLTSAAMRGVACVHTAGALPSRHHIVSGMISARDDVMVGLDRASSPVEWRISEGLVPYETALALMEARAAAIADGVAS